MTLDLSPKTLREVEFREQLRGYHKDDVDDFLERVAAGLETLLDRLREANDRVNRLENRAADRIDDDDTLKRTLILAQRTADLAIQEAQEAAARTTGAAEEEARSLLARAEAQANQMLEQAELQLREDVDRLQGAREQMLGELEELGRWMDGERERLRTSLGAALAHIEDAIPKVATPPVGPAPEVPPARLRWADSEPTMSMDVTPIEDGRDSGSTAAAQGDSDFAPPADQGRSGEDAGAE